MRLVIDDTELVLLTVKGDQAAFGQLVERYEQRLRGYCYQMLSDYSLAEDAAQESFLKAYRSIRRFRSDSLFSTWLFKIAANHCRDLLRSRKRTRAESLEALTEHDRGKIQKLISEGPSTLERVEHRELVAKLLSQLPVEQREIVILRDVEDWDYAQIGQALGCSLDAVKGRLKRARQNLAELALTL